MSSGDGRLSIEGPSGPVCTVPRAVQRFFFCLQSGWSCICRAMRQVHAVCPQLCEGTRMQSGPGGAPEGVAGLVDRTDVSVCRGTGMGIASAPAYLRLGDACAQGRLLVDNFSPVFFVLENVDLQPPSVPLQPPSSSAVHPCA